jgi:hypothetical protein
MKPASTDLGKSLNHSIERRLQLYALAATGTAVLGVPVAADAKVIYTPAHFVLSGDTRYFIDLNRDGVPDFVIANWYSCEDTDCSNQLYVKSPLFEKNAVEGRKGHIWYLASALKQGAEVGENGQTFIKGPFLLRSGYGAWYGAKGRYLGVKFLTNGETHYGWIRMTVNGRVGPHYSAIVTGYAYQTIPDHPIAAGYEGASDSNPPKGASGSLGHLAQGRK